MTSESLLRRRALVARSVWFATAILGVYVLGGGAWFFAGIMLGWLGAVIEVAVRP